MKTDKELLELAAKACGLLKEYCGGEFTNFGVFLMPIPERPDFGKSGADVIDVKPVELVKWNPLTDDGDAFRLAVKLRFKIDIRAVYINVEPYVFNEDANSTTEYFGDNESERSIATRRAIVRAAAAIGESK